MDGIEIGIVAKKANVHPIRTKLTAALALMRDYDPIRFAYLKRDVKRIFVLGSPPYRGQWHPRFAICELTDTYILASETTPAMLASVLAHEAMHARLYRWGFGYQEEQRVRIERVCFKAMVAFARKLPDTEAESREFIIHDSLQQSDRDPNYWTDQNQLEEQLEAFRKSGIPDWAISLLRRGAMARARRYQRSQKRVS